MYKIAGKHVQVYTQSCTCFLYPLAFGSLILHFAFINPITAAV
jgi:hypothetical protein